MSDLSKSLIQTISSENISKIDSTVNPLSADYLDIALSSVLDNSIIGELPIIKTLYTASKTWNSVSNFLLLKKILIFLYELKVVSQSDRKRFLEKMEGSDKQEIINQLVVVLDKHDRFIKSEIQGRLFGALIKGNISKSNYFSLTHAVNQIDAELLKAVETFYVAETGRRSFTDGDMYSMASLRLVGIDNSKVGLFDGGAPEYKMNRLGILLVLIGLNNKIPQDYVEAVIGELETTKLYAEYYE